MNAKPRRASVTPARVNTTREVWKFGTELRPDVQQEALAMFVHRATVENFAARPNVARMMHAAGLRMRLLTDAEWLACTRFAVRRNGGLSRRVRYCQTGYPASCCTAKAVQS